MRKSLVAALVACAEQPLKLDARRFLSGLSSDELEFIAEFLGSCILESDHPLSAERTEFAERIALLYYMRQHAHGAIDSDCKLILLREYLCRLGVPPVALHY